MTAAAVPLALLVSLVVCQPPQRFDVSTVDGVLSGQQVLDIDEDWSVRLGGPAPRLVPGKELVGLRNAAGALPGFPDKNFLLVTNGDRLPVDASSACRLDQDRLYFTPAAPLRSRGQLSLSINYVSILWLEQPAESARDGFLRRLQQEARPRDVVLLRNGDRVEGTLRLLKQGEHVSLDVSGQEKQLAWNQVAGIAFNTELRARPRSKAPFAHLVLAGGARLDLGQPRFDANTGVLTGKPLFGGQVEVPLAHVCALDIRQGAAVYLSDLVPQRHRHTPFLNVSWPLVKDASVAGDPLRLGHDTFDKGLGMHGANEVTYDLAGKYRRFETLVGLNAVTGRKGQVRVKVLVDGKEQDLGKSRLTCEEPLAVRLDIGKARLLTLMTELGDYGDVQAHVDWANARLVK